MVGQNIATDNLLGICLEAITPSTKNIYKLLKINKTIKTLANINNSAIYNLNKC